MNNSSTEAPNCVWEPSQGGPDVPKIVLNVIFFVIGVAGNVCLVFIALRYKSMRTVPNYLITNLAVVDLVFICMVLPQSVIMNLDIILPKHFFFKTDGHCVGFNYIRFVFLGVSIFTLTALSIDRYLAVSKPLACRMLRSGRRRLCAVLLGIAAIWLAAMAAAFPVIQLSKLWGNGLCTSGTTHTLYPTYTYVSMGIFLIVPTVIISTSYCCTARNLLTPHCSLVKVSPRQRRQRLRLAIAIVIIVVIFVCTWSIYYVLDILYLINDKRHYMELDCFTVYPAVEVIKFLRFLMIRINAVANPIILFIVSSSHRRYAKALFCCRSPEQEGKDRKSGKLLHKNSSITVQSSALESRFRKTSPDNGHTTSVYCDQQV